MDDPPGACCAWCGSVDRWSYELRGDRDGIEVLIETAHLVGGGRITSTIVWGAQGVTEWL